MIPVVAVTDLSKLYRNHMALAHVSFVVPKGCIYGLIGPNGAGKTTTLSILAGLVSATSGKVSLLGMDAGANRTRLASKVGFASPHFSFFDYLSGAEVILACGLMHGLGGQEAQRRMQDLFVLLDFEAAAGHYLYEYSQGMLQKLRLACALIHAPEVLLLDEPFLGLDPASVYCLVRTLARMSAQGRTIVLTSHDLSLVERLCHRAGILHEGSFRREIPLAPESAGRPVFMESRSGLEAALWEVAGTPELRELSWM